MRRRETLGHHVPKGSFDYKHTNLRFLLLNCPLPGPFHNSNRNVMTHIIVSRFRVSGRFSRFSMVSFASYILTNETNTDFWSSDFGTEFLCSLRLPFAFAVADHHLCLLSFRIPRRGLQLWRSLSRLPSLPWPPHRTPLSHSHGFKRCVVVGLHLASSFTKARSLEIYPQQGARICIRAMSLARLSMLRSAVSKTCVGPAKVSPMSLGGVYMFWFCVWDGYLRWSRLV